MTEATEQLIAEVRLFIGRIQRSGEDVFISDLETALEAVDNEVCSAEYRNHHGLLTCTRRPGHTEVRHRDYLRGEWNMPQPSTGNSRAERLER